MSNYAIGDVQGCFNTLEKLLKKINFNPKADQLWLCGDLVNRGQASLETLRFVKSLHESKNKISPIVTLGNHDLHLLAIHFGAVKSKESDSLKHILNAPDRDELLSWLLQQPLFYQDTDLGYCMTHAGIPPHWSIKQTKKYAHEVEIQLRGKHAKDFFYNMYGNEPSTWENSLEGWDRLRLITNYLTRMRFCSLTGKLDFASKGCPKDFIPWFESPERDKDQLHVLFGHWAALQGVCPHPNIFALDTGCVWGNQLSALRLEDQKWFRCKNHEID